MVPQYLRVRWYLDPRAFFQCLDCTVFYQFPGLSKEEEDLFYKKEFEKYMLSRSLGEGGWATAKEHINANKNTFERRLKYIEPHLKGAKNILEIGCSSGFMLYPMIKQGIECFGVEPSGAFSEYCNKNGINVYESIESFISDKPNTKKY